ncbi:hypothetical protein [Roseivivax sp. CAU 1753]
MPLQNRVTPFGEIVAVPARGRLMGNRGCLHGADRTLGRARWRGKAWISCVLDFKGRQRRVMTPRSYTELFFSDEAVALAAGHRPCAECRRADYLAFRATIAAAVPALGQVPRAAEIDAHLHAARLTDPPTCAADPNALPDGTFVSPGKAVALLRWRASWWHWSWQGYVAADSPGADCRILTPAPLVAALRHGYRLAAPPDMNDSLTDR